MAVRSGHLRSDPTTFRASSPGGRVVGGASRRLARYGPDVSSAEPTGNELAGAIARVHAEAARGGELAASPPPLGGLASLDPKVRELLLDFVRSGDYARVAAERSRSDLDLADQQSASR